MDNEALRKECMKSRNALVKLASDKYGIDIKVLSGFVEATDSYLNNISAFPIPVVIESTYTDKEFNTALLQRFNKAIINLRQAADSGGIFDKRSLNDQLQSMTSGFEAGSKDLLGVACDNAYFAGVLPGVSWESHTKKHYNGLAKSSKDVNGTSVASIAALKKEGIEIRNEFINSLRQSGLGVSSEVIDKFVASTDNYLNNKYPLNGHAHKANDKTTHGGAVSREFFYDFKESMTNMKAVFDSGMIPCFDNGFDNGFQSANKENVSEFLSLAGKILEEKSFCNAIIKAHLTGKAPISHMLN
jgi:hypothetical protein